MFSKAIGIVGGAGPVASAFLYTTLIELCQQRYGANDYHEFPEIILESFPFTRGARIQQDIALCLAKLQRAGADLFCIASHSFHGCLPDVSSIAFVNLVAESIQEASRCRIAKALILASQPTIDLRLYEQSGLQCCYPPKEGQQLIQTVIRAVGGGGWTPSQAHAVQTLIAALHGEFSFDGIIVACTELPLIHRQYPLSHLPLVDTVQVLAQRLLALA